MLLPTAIKKGLDTKVFGQTIYHFKEVESTNEIAKRLATSGALEGTIVIAEVQKKGKGRLEREWISPKGGIWLSIILRPNIPSSDAPKIPLIAGVAVAKALSNLIECKLKWPNDILIKDKKAGGILSEIEDESVILGIGINANFGAEELPPQIRENATTLKEELGTEISRTKLVQQMLRELEEVYSAFITSGFAKLRKEWKKYSSMLGKRVRVITPAETIEGKATDIDKDGALIIKLDTGATKRVVSGDCMQLE